MPSEVPHKAAPLDRILVIDDLPLIPLALQEVFRPMNPSARVEYSGNIFTALSANTYSNTNFDLVIIGSFQDEHSDNLRQAVTELKKRFGQPIVMIFSSSYDPQIIGQMPGSGVDAYVHKYESIDEIRKAYQQLSAGQPYVSAMFHTLYYDYGYGVRK